MMQKFMKFSILILILVYSTLSILSCATGLSAGGIVENLSGMVQNGNFQNDLSNWVITRRRPQIVRSGGGVDASSGRNYVAFPDNGAARLEQWTRETIQDGYRYILRADVQRPRSGTPNFRVSLITTDVGGNVTLLGFTNQNRFRSRIGSWITIEVSFDTLNDPELMVGNTLGIIIEGENILLDNVRILKQQAVGPQLLITSVPPGSPLETNRMTTPNSFIPVHAENFETDQGVYSFVRWEGAGVINYRNPYTMVHMETNRNVTAIFERISGPRPQLVPLDQGQLTIQSPNERFNLDFDVATHTYQIFDAETQRTWYGRSLFPVLGMYSRDPYSFAIRFQTPNGEIFTSEARVTNESVRFSISENQSGQVFRGLQYPPIFRTDWDMGYLIVSNRSTGSLIEQNNPDFLNSTAFVYANMGLDFPFVGLVNSPNYESDGLMLYVATPFDVQFRYLELDDRLGWPEITWMPSMGKFSYDRQAELFFISEGSYNGIARRYRQKAIEQGIHFPLAERALLNPDINKLKGAGIFWGFNFFDANRFAQEASEKGMHGILGVNHHYSAELMEKFNSMGFLTSSYDNYSDFMDGPAGGHMRDDAVAVGYIGADGELIGGWINEDGSRFLTRSSAMGALQVRDRVTRETTLKPFNSWFIDVTPVLTLFEDHHPLRRFDRRIDASNKQALHRFVSKDLNLVLGGEHVRPWSVREFAFTEGNMGGHFWVDIDNTHLNAVVEGTFVSDLYWKYANSPFFRIPLWDLVFHDAVVSSWQWADSNGMLFNINPEETERKDLFNVLHASIPLYWVGPTIGPDDPQGFGWDRNRERLVQSYRKMSTLNKIVGFSQMLEHRFLSADRTLQMSRFAPDVTVIANFKNQPVRYTRPDGRSMTLAPYGFWAWSEDGTFEQYLIPEGDGRRFVVRSEFENLNEFWPNFF